MNPAGMMQNHAVCPDIMLRYFNTPHPYYFDLRVPCANKKPLHVAHAGVELTEQMFSSLTS